MRKNRTDVFGHEVTAGELIVFQPSGSGSDETFLGTAMTAYDTLWATNVLHLYFYQGSVFREDDMPVHGGFLTVTGVGAMGDRGNSDGHLDCLGNEVAVGDVVVRPGMGAADLCPYRVDRLNRTSIRVSKEPGFGGAGKDSGTVKSRNCLIISGCP